MENIEVSNFIKTIMKEDLESGKVNEIITRFPPEPNAYLHIGHARAIITNFELAKSFGGYTNLRFDDTNPVKEGQEFVDGIIENLAWLGYEPQNVFFGSDYFEATYEKAILLIKKGLAYVCDLTKEQMTEYRGTYEKPGIDSPYRNRSVEENLDFQLHEMILNITELPAMFAMIFEAAFDVKAIMGGFAGSAVVIGIKRGLFSNEAGMGSAPNASASADVDHPVKQGLVQIISVFIDTLLICSSTAIMLLVSGVEGKSGTLDGIPYVQAAISSNVGEWGIHFITFSIFAFAFSSLIGNYFYAESNILFIKNNKLLLNIFRVTCVVAVFLGAQADFGLVWNLADVTMGLMAIVNILAIFLLGNIAIKVLKNYEKQKKAGQKPVFYEDEVGLTGTVWIRDKK